MYKYLTELFFITFDGKNSHLGSHGANSLDDVYNFSDEKPSVTEMFAHMSLMVSTSIVFPRLSEAQVLGVSIFAF